MLPAVSRPLGDTTASNNTNNIYHFDDSLTTSYLHLQGEGQIHHLHWESSWLSDHPGTQLSHYPLALSNHWICHESRTGPGKPHHTEKSAALLFSHHSKLHPTGWKHHPCTSQNSYRCPSPRTWPRYILSGDLTPQTRHPSDRLRLGWRGGRQKPHFNTCAGEREKWVSSHLHHSR